MTKRLPDNYRAVVLDQQAQLQRLIKSVGIGPVHRLYQDMLTEIERKLRAAEGGSFGHTQLRGMLGQVRLGLANVVHQMAGTMGKAAYEIGIKTARQTLGDVAKLEAQFTGVMVPLPVLETARLNGLVHGQTSSLLRAHTTSMARYGSHLVGTMETELGAAIATAENSTQAIDRVMRAAENEWWQAERIVRTELSYSSNASVRAGLDEQAAELDGDLWSRWSEHVTDGGVAMDDRVGEDSLAMHGQVAPPGGSFTQPAVAPMGETVSPGLVGQSWEHPPNRPNDRSVLTPWRFHWGVPGWIYEDGSRQTVTRAIVDAINGKYKPTTPAPEVVEVAKPAPPAPEPVPEAIAQKPAASEVSETQEMPEDTQISLAGQQFSAMLPDQQQALTDYAAGGYREINTSIRAGKPPSSVKAIDRAFIQAPPLPEPTRLYRGIGAMENAPPGVSREVPPEVLAAEVGDTFTEPAYSSTSVRTRGSFWRNAKVRMVIDAPAGTKAISVGKDLSPTRWAEREVLLARNTRFTVTKRVVEGERITLHVSPAPPVAKPQKDPKRVEQARKAAAASVERRREIHATAKSNLPQELQVAWDQEGHKFMREEALRIRGVKDPVLAGSKLSEAFAEKYGGGEASVFGNEGDRFQKRTEMEAKHAETWADDQEKQYYEAAYKEMQAEGQIDEHGKLTEPPTPQASDWRPPAFDDDDPPF